MRILTLIIFYSSITINCIALEIILNPYESIDYSKINTYKIQNNENDCTCYQEEKNYYTQDYDYWLDDK